ncbi:hypothetical protein NQZ68_033600 [Dissostichus eleginoides]|nr:hypothetical protein NQZ68_033600 [Dissostichus eleginoides]
MGSQDDATMAKNWLHRSTGGRHCQNSDGHFEQRRKNLHVHCPEQKDILSVSDVEINLSFDLKTDQHMVVYPHQRKGWIQSCCFEGHVETSNQANRLVASASRGSDLGTGQMEQQN